MNFGIHEIITYITMTANLTEEKQHKEHKCYDGANYYWYRRDKNLLKTRCALIQVPSQL